MNNKQRLQNIFQEIFTSSQFDIKKIEKYFAPSYNQWVDGHELDYEGFVEHMQAQKERVESVDIRFKSLVEEGDKVSSIHLVNAITKSGNEVKGKVIAHFTFKEDKLVECEELTFFDKANEEDRDLGHTRG